MQDYREIDRIRKDFVAVRSLAKRLLDLPDAHWNDWEIGLLQHMTRHKGPVGTTNKSMAAMCGAWLCRKVLQL
jgi:hypothetical protein